MQARNPANRTLLPLLLLSGCVVGQAGTTPVAAMDPAQGEPDQVAKDHPRQVTDESDKPDASEQADASRRGAVNTAVAAILAKWEKVQAFSAHIRIETGTGKVISKSGGGKWEPQMHVRGEGIYECFKKDGKSLIRMELDGESPVRHIGDGGPSRSSILRLYDGEFVYSVGKEGGQTHASKVNRPDDDFILLGGPELFKKLRRQFILSRQPDETLGTRKTVVLEGRPKKGDGKTLYWFDKETGILVKLAMFNRTGNLQNRLTLDEINMDPKFSPKRFVFIPPKGVEVKDLTKRDG